MFKNLVFASATAALALAVTAPDFGVGSEAAAQPSVQSAQFKATPLETGPGDKPSKTVPDKRRGNFGFGSTYIDLRGVHPGTNPMDGSPGSGFCHSLTQVPHNGSKYVRINVANKGTHMMTGPVEVKFRFHQNEGLSGTAWVSYSSVNVQGDTVYRVAQTRIPRDAWNDEGQVHFKIEIDPANKIGENNESNNVFTGSCVQPGAS